MLKALGKPFRRKSRDGERPAEAQTPPGYRSPSARQGGFIHGSRGARGLGATGARVPSRLQFEQQGGGGGGGGGGGSPRNGRSPGGNASDSSDASRRSAGRGRAKSRADDDEWVLQEALNEYVGRKRWPHAYEWSLCSCRPQRVSVLYAVVCAVCCMWWLCVVVCGHLSRCGAVRGALVGPS